MESRKIVAHFARVDCRPLWEPLDPKVEPTMNKKTTRVRASQLTFARMMFLALVAAATHDLFKVALFGMYFV